MEVIDYSKLRSNLSSILDKVNNNHTPVIVTRQRKKAAVIISLEDFKSYEETAYLMASPKNAQRLNQSVKEAEEGQLLKKNLEDL